MDFHHMMNGHQHVQEGADEPDAIVTVEMMPRSTQVIITVEDKKNGSVKVTPASFHTSDAMKVAYMLVEKVIDVMMTRYRMGTSAIENHTLLITFHLHGSPSVVLATSQYEFVNDAMTSKALVNGMYNDLSEYLNIVVLMKGEREYEADA